MVNKVHALALRYLPRTVTSSSRLGPMVFLHSTQGTAKD